MASPPLVTSLSLHCWLVLKPVSTRALCVSCWGCLDLAHPFLEPHEVLLGPFLQLEKVPLDEEASTNSTCFDDTKGMLSSIPEVISDDGSALGLLLSTPQLHLFVNGWPKCTS